MHSGRAAVAAGAALLVGLLPCRTWADQAPAPEEARPVGPFAAGRIGIELGAAGLGEVWHLNDGREWFAGGTAGIWWAFREGGAFVVRFHATEVFQREPRHAFVNAVVPSMRWRFRQGERVDAFAELGLGLSWSDTPVPPRGTHFNYLAEAGVGLARRVGRQTHAVVGFRLLHLSNNDREGAGRNPDIEAIGGYAALLVGF
jgi:hypothetical protein